MRDRFDDASDEIKDLIDPTWRLSVDYVDEEGKALGEDATPYDHYQPTTVPRQKRLAELVAQEGRAGGQNAKL